MLHENKNINIFTTVILYCLHINIITGQSSKKCDFVPQKGTFVEVHCNGRHITNFPLASTLPENTASIHLKDNQIQQLPNQPSQVHRNKVWNIDLSGNVIYQVLEDKLGKTFTHVSNLNLSNNRIRFLSKNSFQYLRSLSVLNLSYNKLASISQDWFSHLLKLSLLDLGHNIIGVVTETKRGWPKRLKELNMSYNKLRIIPPLPTKASVDLGNNPVFCGCDLRVNKQISGTSVKVQCHKLSYFREPVQIQKGFAKYKKYKAVANICQATGIINFSYVVANDQRVITCIASDSYPDAVLFIYHETKLIKISKEHISLNVKKPGLYSCKVSNYISLEQRELVIPVLTPGWSKSDLDVTTGFTDSQGTF